MYKKYGNNTKRSRRPKSNRTRKAYTRKGKVSPSIKSYVKKAISSNTENKVWINYGANQTIQTASGIAPAFQNLLPQITQGTSHGGRIGNEIKIKQGFIKGHVNLLPYNASTNNFQAPLYVKMWLCSNKKINSNVVSGTDITTNFFELTGGTAGFQGNMLDMEFTPNKEYWTVYATKTFELGLTTASAAQYQDNSRFSRPFYFSFGRYLKSKLKYDDNTAVPLNKNMFLLFQAVNADGSSSSVYPAEYHFNTRVEYEDA